MPINPDAVGTKGEPARRSWTSKDALHLRPRRGRRRGRPARRAGLHHREHQRRAPAGAADDGRRARRRLRRRHGRRSAPSTRPCSSTASRASRCTGEIPVEGELETVGEITGIYDKGKGAVVVSESDGHRSSTTGEPLFTTRMSAFIRGEGGWGGDRGPSGRRTWRPSATPDHTVTYADPPRPGAALPPVRRPQPAALRPVVRGDGRLRPADPPRPLHLRLHRPGAAAHAVRQRPGPLQGRWTAASRRR